MLVASLIESRILINRNKDQVHETLGNPDAQTSARQIVYSLGLRIMDEVELIFTLGTDDKVIKAEIIEN
jgi:hypothetical protein